MTFIVEYENEQGHDRQMEIDAPNMETAYEVMNAEYPDLSISIEEAWALFEDQQRRCALTGVELTMYQYVDLPTDPSRGGTTGRRVNGTASLDRINSSLGYIKGNVQWVHKYVNAMKLDHNQDEFIRWCALVVQHSVLGDNNLIATQSESYSVQPSISHG